MCLHWCIDGLDHSGGCVYSGALVGWITVVVMCTVVYWWAGSHDGCVYTGVLMGWITVVVVSTVVHWWAGSGWWLCVQWCIGGLDHSGGCVYSGEFMDWITMVVVSIVVR